jgi:hypothetical protein
MTVSCGVAVLFRLTDAPPVLIEHLLAATGASEAALGSTTANELDAVLRQFGLRLIWIEERARLEGPRLDRWLRDRPAGLIAPTFVLLVQHEGRAAAHWLAVARGVVCYSYTRGEWIADLPGDYGPDGGWRVREALASRGGLAAVSKFSST